METVAFDGSQPSGAVGHFTYTTASDHWAWSDGIYTMHGYAPGEVPPTTEVLLRHKHPEDRVRAYEVLENAVETGHPFTCYHRIIDRAGRVRSVLSVGHGVRGSHGRVERVEGYFVDLTEVRHKETEAEVQTALARIREHREVIDEAKGMIMLATGCHSEAAFACLRRYSQTTNMKVHDIAHRLVEAVDPDHHGTDLVMIVLTDLARDSRSREAAQIQRRAASA
jgi:hypothetical protein